MDISQIIMDLAAKYPVIIAILSAMGVARLIFKPLFSFLHAIADATPSQKDNQILDDVEGSKIYKGIAYVLDYIGSIKLPGAK